MLKPIVFAILAFCILYANAESVTETEIFSIPITREMFNWSYFGYDTQYQFHPSIMNKPDLPNWLHYIYSGRHHSGFIYGAPPQNQKDLMIQVVALNKVDYETKHLVFPLNIMKKEKVAAYEVQLKIDNLNVEDLIDEHRMERLKDIFRKKLWRESADDIYTTFLASAVELGARLPLLPDEGEGVVLKLGSHKPHSQELLQLHEEVKPLSKMTWCPRDFKRTTVERLFRDADFNLDWCTFRLIEADSVPNIEKETTNLRSKLIKDDPYVTKHGNRFNLFDDNSKFLSIAKKDVPQRSYIHEFTFTIMVPSLVMISLVSVLSFILCFQCEGKPIACVKSETKNVSNQPSNRSGLNSGAGVGTNNKNYDSNPNESSSNAKSTQNLLDYNRPQPPPYLGANTSLILRQRQGPSQERLSSQARTLEESLQLLNEANIGDLDYGIDRIIYPSERAILDADFLLKNDLEGNAVDEDYIHIKPDFELSFRSGNGAVKKSGDF